MTMSILELLQHIVNEPAPRLSAKAINKRASRRESMFGLGGGNKRMSMYSNAFSNSEFPEAAERFVALCLLKDPEARWSPQDLLVSIPLPFSSVC